MPTGNAVIVRARCPAPYRHVPAGSRRERREVLSIRVDAEIPEVEPDAFVPIPLAGREAAALYARDGALWERLTDPNGRDGPRLGIGRDPFLEWLSGAMPSRTVIETRLRRTPLVAVSDRIGAKGFPESWETRGTSEEPRSRTVVSDLRDRAGMAAARFLSHDVALAGDGVYLRCHPAAHLQVRDILVISHAPHAGWEGGRLRSIRDTRAPDGDPVRIVGNAAAILAALPDDAGIGCEARALANFLPCAALARIEHLASGKAAGWETPAALAPALRPFADAGSIGSLTDAEIPEALAVASEASRLLGAAPGARRFGLDWNDIEDHLRSGAVSGIGVRDGDIAGLAGLAPR